MARFKNANTGEWETFQSELFEWPSTPPDSSDDGSVSGESAYLDVRTVVGTCTIVCGLNGQQVCEFPVELRTTVQDAVERASAALLRGGGWRVQLVHGSRTLGAMGASLADMLSGGDVSDVLRLQAVILQIG